MRQRTIPLDEQFNELPSDQAQFWLADAERYQQVHAALATLPELYRSVIALRYLEEMARRPRDSKRHLASVCRM